MCCALLRKKQKRVAGGHENFEPLAGNIAPPARFLPKKPLQHDDE